MTIQLAKRRRSARTSKPAALKKAGKRPYSPKQRRDWCREDVLENGKTRRNALSIIEVFPELAPRK